MHKHLIDLANEMLSAHDQGQGYRCIDVDENLRKLVMESSHHLGENPLVLEILDLMTLIRMPVPNGSEIPHHYYANGNIYFKWIDGYFDRSNLVTRCYQKVLLLAEEF